MPVGKRGAAALEARIAADERGRRAVGECLRVDVGEGSVNSSAPMGGNFPCVKEHCCSDSWQSECANEERWTAGVGRWLRLPNLASPQSVPSLVGLPPTRVLCRNCELVVQEESCEPGVAHSHVWETGNPEVRDAAWTGDVSGAELLPTVAVHSRFL